MKGTRYVLLFDGDCVACSRVARAVSDLQIADLEVRPRTDLTVAQALEQAGIAAPVAPSLLVTGAGGTRLLRGWRMRRVLAGLMGWRRARAIMRLSAAEAEARLARRRAQAGSGSTRRRIVSTGLVGIVAGVLLPRSASAAPQSAGTATSALKLANDTDVARALASPAMRRAMATWGPVSSGAVEVTDDSQTVLVFSHSRDGREVITLVDNSADAAADDPAALSMTGSPANKGGVRFYTVAGTVLGDISQDADGRTRAVPAQDTAVPGQIMEPAFDRTCWLLCMNGVILPMACLQACFNCGLAIGALINCSYCGLCAGTRAITCFKRCR